MQRLTSFFSAFLLGVGVLSGCYTLRPATAPVAEGTEVAFDVNDAGRVALSTQVGPEVSQLEGRLVSANNGDYVLAVNAVRFVRGDEQIWKGERVRLAKDHVRNSYERRFSPGRTATAAALTAGGVLVFFASRSLLGFGSEQGDDPRPPDPGNTLTRPIAGPRP
jgi:hypothetical protein